jgi:hypothetical protein
MCDAAAPVIQRQTRARLLSSAPSVQFRRREIIQIDPTLTAKPTEILRYREARSVTVRILRQM